MNILVAEDDFTSRVLLQKLLAPYGEVHVAANGREALDAYEIANQVGEPYGLICLDIMMPEMDGQDLLRSIRRLESDRGIPPGGGVKVLMTTALTDSNNIIRAFHEQCDGYLVKPIVRARLEEELRKFGLAA